MFEDLLQKEEVFRHFAKHVASLSWFDQPIAAGGKPKGDWRFFCVSGFVLSVRGLWCLVTAGHILRDLDENLREKKVAISDVAIFDAFGHEAVSSKAIPFDYEGAARTYIYDKAAGLDFGLVALSPYYRTLMEANGVAAIAEENWIHQHKIDFEHFFMIGLPTSMVEKGVRPDEKREACATLVVIPLVKCEMPDDLRETRYRRFVAKLHDSVTIESIDGMSGGPIYGLGRSTDGRLRYWIIAVQSSWMPKRRMTFGCPVPVFAELVERDLQRCEACVEEDDE